MKAFTKQNNKITSPMLLDASDLLYWHSGCYLGERPKSDLKKKSKLHKSGLKWIDVGLGMFGTYLKSNARHFFV